MYLGVETDTLDAQGNIITSMEEDSGKHSGLKEITGSRVAQVVSQFKGPQKQVPPIYSALKHQGVPLYRLARQGRPVEKPPRDIEIYDIEVLAISLPLITINVRCSSGTYIRSLARDIGVQLGCGAHLTTLCRTSCCNVPLDKTLPLSRLEEMDDRSFNEQIVPMARAVSSLPAVSVDDTLLKTIRFGQPLGDTLPGPSFRSHTPGDKYFLRILDPGGRLAAIVEYDHMQRSYNYCCVFVD